MARRWAGGPKADRSWKDPSGSTGTARRSWRAPRSVPEAGSAVPAEATKPRWPKWYPGGSAAVEDNRTIDAAAALPPDLETTTGAESGAWSYWRRPRKTEPTEAAATLTREPDRSSWPWVNGSAPSKAEVVESEDDNRGYWAQQGLRGRRNGKATKVEAEPAPELADAEHPA